MLREGTMLRDDDGTAIGILTSRATDLQNLIATQQSHIDELHEQARAIGECRRQRIDELTALEQTVDELRKLADRPKMTVEARKMREAQSAHGFDTFGRD